MNRMISLENNTTVHEFFLLGFSDFPKFQLHFFLFFLLLYLMTLMGNLLILVLIHVDHHLHTPMYLFLGHLASVDIFSSTVSVPRMIADLFSDKKTISRTACVTQIFFFVMFACAEIFLLAGMSYDRYVAICRPLHYTAIMSWRVCFLIPSVAWALGFTNAFINSICTLRLHFCGQNIIHSIFCELPLLLQLSCTDIFINILLIYIAAFLLAFISLGVTFIPYVHIFRLILRIPTKEGKHKAFSTCSSHLTVVFIF
ncbi:olfactory receptor 5G9-like [Discoglossus pictus]